MGSGRQCKGGWDDTSRYWHEISGRYGANGCCSGYYKRGHRRGEQRVLRTGRGRGRAKGGAWLQKRGVCACVCVCVCVGVCWVFDQRGPWAQKAPRRSGASLLSVHARQY